MAYIGMFALGWFVGSVVTLGFTQAQNDFLKAGTTILGAALSGVAIAFLDKINAVGNARDSIFLYPVGLLIAVPWFYMPQILARPEKLIKWGGTVGTVVCTIAAVLLALFPDVRRLVQ